MNKIRPIISVFMLAAAGTIAFQSVAPDIRSDRDLVNSIDEVRAYRDRALADPPDAHDVEVLTQYLRIGDPCQQVAAAKYLEEIASPLAIDALANSVDRVVGFKGFPESWSAARSLGNLGGKAQSAIPQLIRVIRMEPAGALGWAAASALGRIADPDDSRARAALTQAAQSPDAYMRQCATQALQLLDSRRTN
jgi:HEAT repeat protein